MRNLVLGCGLPRGIPWSGYFIPADSAYSYVLTCNFNQQRISCPVGCVALTVDVVECSRSALYLSPLQGRWQQGGDRPPNKIGAMTTECVLLLLHALDAFYYMFIRACR